MVGMRPDSCNVNLYEDGSHAVGWHTDDEAGTVGMARFVQPLTTSRPADLVPKPSSRCRHCFAAPWLRELTRLCLNNTNGALVLMIQYVVYDSWNWHFSDRVNIFCFKHVPLVSFHNRCKVPWTAAKVWHQEKLARGQNELHLDVHSMCIASTSVLIVTQQSSSWDRWTRCLGYDWCFRYTSLTNEEGEKVQDRLHLGNGALVFLFTSVLVSIQNCFFGALLQNSSPVSRLMLSFGSMSCSKPGALATMEAKGFAASDFNYFGIRFAQHAQRLLSKRTIKPSLAFIITVTLIFLF